MSWGPVPVSRGGLERAPFLIGIYLSQGTAFLLLNSPFFWFVYDIQVYFVFFFKMMVDLDEFFRTPPWPYLTNT